MNVKERINGHAKWAAVVVALIGIVAAGTYQHARAVSQLASIKEDVARIERAQVDQGHTLESLKQAVWTLAATRGTPLPVGGTQP